VNKAATEQDVVRARLEGAEMMLRHIADPYDVRNGDPRHMVYCAKMALHTMAQIRLVDPRT